jgi:hypothetical protein
VTDTQVSAARKWVHAAGMQGAWFAAALSASTPWHPAGALANLFVYVVHVGTSGNVGREVIRGGVSLGLGLLVEVVQQRVGGMRAQQAGVLPPAWLVSLWPVFASAMMRGHALVWLRSKPWLAAIIGAVAGPLSYAGGGRLRALELEGPRSFVTIAVCWAIAMPALAWLADWLEGESPGASP